MHKERKEMILCILLCAPSAFLLTEAIAKVNFVNLAVKTDQMLIIPEIK